MRQLLKLLFNIIGILFPLISDSYQSALILHISIIYVLLVLQFSVDWI